MEITPCSVGRTNATYLFMRRTRLIARLDVKNDTLVKRETKYHKQVNFEDKAQGDSGIDLF